ncbi:sulfatase-like hydrolase/transferase [candidate division KSB1 bacterium]|nr:sulfatase-like hydrolase/transferase [candidate division KSB1 bacterium]
MKTKNKPNILFIMSDEHPVFLTGCYGHKQVKSPAIDNLSRQGVTFDAAYCPSPICAPSRAAMMTGRHVHTIEVWDNAAPLRCDWPTFAHDLSAGGYHTILCGKMHFVGPDQLHGFDERWTQDIYPATFDWTRSNRGEVAINNGQCIDRIFEAGMGRSRDMDYDDEVIFRAEYGLRRLAAQQNNPFMLCVSFTAPHYPFRAPEKYWKLYNEDEIELPVIPSDYLEREHIYVKWLRRHGSFDRLVPDSVCRRARRAILGRITMLDDYISRLLNLLQELKLQDDTIVIYAGDHGDMMGEHGLWFKNAAYEWSSRVPLIISGPGISHQRINEVVSLLDIGPTLCGLTKTKPVYKVSDGRNLCDLVLGKRKAEKGLAIMENYGEGVLRGWRMIRSGSLKMTYVPGYEPEVFDLSKDPDEWNNIYNEAEYRTAIEELQKQVLQNWHPEGADERRWQSEERRLAILKANQPLDWQTASPPPPHPLRRTPNSPIDNVSLE